MSMVTAHVEVLAQCLNELKPHLVAHWQELAIDQDKVPLSPQYEVYLEREAKGELLCVVLRDAGAVAGYFLGFIAPALHYSSCLTLTMDIFWIHPEYRGVDSLSVIEEHFLYEELFDVVKREAKRRGVKRCYYGSKVHKSSAVIFEAMGMKPVDVYYTDWWGE